MHDFENLLEKIKEINGFESYNELQNLAFKRENREVSLLVSSPTTSGKTMIAEVFAVYNALQQKRVIYLSPLKALAMEQFKSFKKKYSKNFNLKIGISTGDLDSNIFL